MQRMTTEGERSDVEDGDDDRNDSTMAKDSRGGQFGGISWQARIKQNSCCQETERILKKSYKETGGKQLTLGDAGVDGTGTTLASQKSARCHPEHLSPISDLERVCG